MKILVLLLISLVLIQAQDNSCRSWTPWYTRADTIGMGSQLVPDMRKLFPDTMCKEAPSGMEVVVQSDNTPANQTGQIFRQNQLPEGFQCVDSDQATGEQCKDYQVRYCCDNDEVVVKCKNWTGWHSRDLPSGTGDWELVQNHVDQYKICTAPTAMMVRTVSTQTPASATGETFLYNSLPQGFVCRNLDQRDGRCLDYEVNYCCDEIEPPTCKNWFGWISRDYPSGTGDWENVQSLYEQYPEKMCLKPTMMEARRISDKVDAALTGQTLLHNELPAGFVCLNSQNGPKGCDNYEVRYCCEQDIVVDKCKDGEWSNWYDRDDPTGTGDWENFNLIYDQYKNELCPKPTAIDARTVNGHVPAENTGEYFESYGMPNGFVCINNQQKDLRCQDYEVRFCCPKVQQYKCKDQDWTAWFNRDLPSGYGDFETLADFIKEGKKVCQNPTEVRGRVVGSHVPADQTGEVLTILPNIGLTCINAQQPDQSCLNYEVQFCCPHVEEKCKDEDWTAWLDRDNPSGYGDYETLAEFLKEQPQNVCAKPTAIEAKTLAGVPADQTGDIVTMSLTSGFYCVNSLQPDQKCEDYQVRFCCPKTPVCKDTDWTSWLDRDDTSGYGDFETLNEFLTETPDKVCQSPTAIEGRTVGNNIPAGQTGETLQMSPNTGLICLNSQQPSGHCKYDYEVRFCCPQQQVDPCKDGVWTPFLDRDNPSGYGDFETLAEFLKEQPTVVCKNPTAIKGRTVNGHIPAQNTGEIITMTPSYGLSCQNAQQFNNKQCMDYEVSFCCPKNIATPPADSTGAQTQPADATTQPTDPKTVDTSGQSAVKNPLP